MKKIIRDIDEQRGVVQVTTTDERVYIFPDETPETGLPTYKVKPSSTYILSLGYPKGKYFQEWLKKMGDEAELVKVLAGEKGSKIHQAVEKLLMGEETEDGKIHRVGIDDKFTNPTTDKEEELTPEEYDSVWAFTRWWNELNQKSKVEIIGVEFTVDSDEYDYAGTVDMLLRIDGELWMIDLKTGQNVYEDYILQVSSYKHAFLEKSEMMRAQYEIPQDAEVNLGIIQVGYKRNKNGYKFTEVSDKFQTFLSAKNIFHNEVSKLPYTQIEYPFYVELEMPKVSNKPKKKHAVK